MCSSSEAKDTTTTDRLTSVECYSSLDDAATQLHGGTAYTATGSATDAGTTYYSFLAGRLSNARSLWGQSFNGTGNITGAMTGVSTIDGFTALRTVGGSVGTNVVTQNILKLYGTTYGNDSSYLTTAGKLSWGDGGPQLRFGTQSGDNDQSIALIFTDHDSIAAGASLNLVSNQTDAWFIAPHIKALTGFVGNLTGDVTGKVNGHTVNADVPSGAKFTDTTYDLSNYTQAYAASKHTLTEVLAEMQSTQGGRVGSVKIDTASNDILADWYNYLWMPHRVGGKILDNYNYGTLLLAPMRISGSVFVVMSTKDGGVSECRALAYKSDIPTTLPNPHSIKLTVGSTDFGTYDGSVSQSVTLKAGSNVTLSTETDTAKGTGTVTINATDTKYDKLKATNFAAITGNLSTDGKLITEAQWNLLVQNIGNRPDSSAYCITTAATAAKTATHTGFALRTNSYELVTIKEANTAKSALTLDINGTGAKPIYINGSVSSATNYTLPAGTYLVKYDGTNYHFRTDDYAVTGNITGTASTIRGTLPISKGGTGKTTAIEGAVALGVAPALIQANMYPTVTTASGSVTIAINSNQPATLPAYTYIKHVYLYSSAGALLGHGDTTTTSSSQDVSVTISTSQAAAAAASGTRIVACGAVVGGSSSPRPVVAEWIVQ